MTVREVINAMYDDHHIKICEGGNIIVDMDSAYTGAIKDEILDKEVCEENGIYAANTEEIEIYIEKD